MMLNWVMALLLLSVVIVLALPVLAMWWVLAMAQTLRVLALSLWGMIERLQGGEEWRATSSAGEAPEWMAADGRKACPFCGSRRLGHRHGPLDEQVLHMVVHCQDCAAEAPVQQWDKRAGELLPGAQLPTR